MEVSLPANVGFDKSGSNRTLSGMLRGLAITRPGYRGCITTFTAQKMDFTKANSTLEEKRDWPSRDGFSS